MCAKPQNPLQNFGNSWYILGKRLLEFSPDFLVHFSNSFTCQPSPPSWSYLLGLTLKIQASLAMAFSWTLHVLFLLHRFVPVLPFARNTLFFSSLPGKHLGLFIKFMPSLSLQVCSLGGVWFSVRVRWFCTQGSFGVVSHSTAGENPYSLSSHSQKRENLHCFQHT